MTVRAGNILLNRYVVNKQLGEGYFGRVYLAHDNVLPRDVAIKELKGRFLSEAVIVKRFIDDARTAAALGHPNIVTVHDLQPPNKPRYIVMEYIKNGTLADLLDVEKKLTVPRALKITIDICRGLEVAHRKGIIHRDIKPANILIADGEIAKVCDFGIAHLPTDFGGYDQTKGRHPGTPIYRSPEQVKGENLDGRSDLYTVGVVLYEMLTGTLYFDSNDCNNLYDIDQAILNRMPSPPSHMNPDITPQLDSIVLKFLNKERRSRYYDATEVIRDIEGALRIGSAKSGIAHPRLLSISNIARREGNQVRYQIRIEAENQGDGSASWGGITINIPTIISKELIDSSKIQVWSSDERSPTLIAPGDALYGFREDGSFGEKEAKCLLIEAPISDWKPSTRLSLETSLLLPITSLEAHVRTWATWKNPNGSEISNGDPDWSSEAIKDQQGIPANILTITFESN